jgi:hypothetical protein
VIAALILNTSPWLTVYALIFDIVHLVYQVGLLAYVPKMIRSLLPVPLLQGLVQTQSHFTRPSIYFGETTFLTPLRYTSSPRDSRKLVDLLPVPLDLLL